MVTIKTKVVVWTNTLNVQQKPIQHAMRLLCNLVKSLITQKSLSMNTQVLNILK